MGIIKFDRTKHTYKEVAQKKYPLYTFYKNIFHEIRLLPIIYTCPCWFHSRSSFSTRRLRLHNPEWEGGGPLWREHGMSGKMRSRDFPWRRVFFLAGSLGCFVVGCGLSYFRVIFLDLLCKRIGSSPCISSDVMLYI